MPSLYEPLFRRYGAMELAPPPEGCWRNYLGLATDASMFGNTQDLVDSIIPESPWPDDKAYGTDSEHAAVLAAIDLAWKAGRSTFSMMELGAGWGPWIAEAAIVCQRERFDSVRLVGVEADAGKFEAMQEHFRRNDLLGDPRIHVQFLNGAAWSEDTTLKFPKISMLDHGGAASETDTEYRGNVVEMLDVPAWGLQSICATLDEIIDVGHWDVQGAELRIATTWRDFLDNRVRSLQIGTHSRYIEGQLMELFRNMGWQVVYQIPCSMQWDNTKPTLEGMTTRDGEIQVRNPKLWA